MHTTIITNTLDIDQYGTSPIKQVISLLTKRLCYHHVATIKYLHICDVIALLTRAVLNTNHTNIV